MWLQQRTTEAQSEMNQRYIQSLLLCEADPSRSSADTKSRIRDLLVSARWSSSGSNDM